MPNAPKTLGITMRIPDAQRAAADALAVSAGDRTAAIRECVEGWAKAVAQAQRANADLFARHEWNMLADAVAGVGLIPEMVPETDGPYPWGQHVAMELHDSHAINALGSKWFPETWSRKKIATRVAEMCQQIQLLDGIHGYALMDTLRLFWSPTGVDHIDHAADDWWCPEFRAELVRRAEFGGAE